MRSTLTTLASAFLLAATASAQSVLVVAPAPGPGVFSTGIQSAVNAAANSDVVLVKSGTYPGFNIDSKSVSIVGETSASVVVNGRVFITNLTASQRVLLQRLTIHGNNSTPAVVLLNAPGPIWIESCTVTAGALNGTGLVGVSVNSCPNVVIQRRFMTGGSGVIGSTNDMGAPALHVAASKVAVSDSQCIGGNGAPTLTPGLPSAGFGNSGMRVVSGTAFASGTTFRGGNGALPVPPQFPGGGAGPGIHTSGAVTTLQCTFISGVSGNPTMPPPTPVVVAGGSHQALPGVARSFSATSPVRESQTSSFSAIGIVGEMCGALYSMSPGPASLMPQFEGALALTLASVETFSLGTITASGTAYLPVTAPNLPAAVQAATFWCQSVFFDATFTYAVVGPASAVVVLDSAI